MASKYEERHRMWTTYANKELKAGRKPIKFKDYDVEPTYFNMISKQTPESRLEMKPNPKTVRTKAIESGLKAAGVDWEKDKPSTKLRRKK